MPENTTPHPSAVGTPFSRIEDIVADIRAGKMVIMVDDENRENEGDLLMAHALSPGEDLRVSVQRTGKRWACRRVMAPASS